MVKVDLKGIHTDRAKGRTYYYAWRGGPRLRGEPGSPEFHASYNDAVAERRAPDASRFRTVVVAYRASEEYRRLADSTKRNWGPWLDKIADYFGELRIAQFDRHDKIRPIIRQWRNRYAEHPGAADVGMGVLSRVLSYAVDPLGKLGSNPSEGIKRLHSADRSEIIWAESDIATLKASCSPEIAHAVDLAVHTGLRLGDLTKLCWSHVGDDRIVIPTRKSRGRQKAIIPLYSALQAVLADIPKHSTTILTNRRGRPWRDLASAFVDAKAKAGIEGLHFHDLRGTAATYFYTAGLAERDIAEILGWEEESVHKIIRRYVGRNAAIIALLDKAGR